MATAAKVKTKVVAPAQAFSPDLFDAISKVGDQNEIRFILRQVKLADGEFHKLTKRVTVRIRWDSAVQCFVVYDNKYLSAAQGFTAAEALDDYLERIGYRIQILIEDESKLGKGLANELHELRALFSLNSPNAS